MKIKNTLTVKEEVGEVERESKEKMADIISQNWARALFNFFNRKEKLKESGKYKKAWLLIPDESPFFNSNETYFNEVMNK